jgi:type I restriction enzyme S subunit
MMSCIATIGKCGITTRPSFTNQQINSLICGDEADPQFVYYCFTQLGHALEAVGGGGSVYTNVSKSRFEGIELTLPPLPTQRAIAHVLGTLDDMIELNRETNEILEEMARALFKSWFVDFDPVRAKLEGRPPAGMDAATAALFPDHFQDSELGQIPKGWEVRPIGDVVPCLGGGTPSTSEPSYWENGSIHWTTPKDLSNLSFPFLIDTDRRITEAGLAKISSGLLPAGTLLMSSRAPVGYLAIADIPVAINQGYIAMRPNELVSNYYLLNWCHFNMVEIENRASGTTFAEISKSAFRPIPMLLPNVEVIEAYSKCVGPIYSQMVSNLYESRDLATLRDTLLPKLLSGEISAPVAKELIAAST